MKVRDELFTLALTLMPGWNDRYAIEEGIVHYSGYNVNTVDNGYVYVIQHRLNTTTVFALHGHLDSSVLRLSPGTAVSKGQVPGSEIQRRMEDGLNLMYISSCLYTSLRRMTCLELFAWLTLQNILV
jgi:hypothetical protein